MGATYSQARAADAQMPRSDKSEVLGVDVSSTKATLDISSFRQATLGITDGQQKLCDRDFSVDSRSVPI